MMQTDFFDKIDGHDKPITVSVFEEGDHYRATICGGWWTACGKTEKEAVGKVVAAYENEVGLKFLERSMA